MAPLWKFGKFTVFPVRPNIPEDTNYIRYVLNKAAVAVWIRLLKEHISDIPYNVIVGVKEILYSIIRNSALINQMFPSNTMWNIWHHNNYSLN
jgi:hypothetical protein